MTFLPSSSTFVRSLIFVVTHRRRLFFSDDARDRDAGHLHHGSGGWRPSARGGLGRGEHVESTSGVLFGGNGSESAGVGLRRTVVAELG